MKDYQTMKEEFLHYLWRFSAYETGSLRTCNGEPISVIHPGQYNRKGAGPDFSNARIRIGETLWIGQVEIHIRSSDWIRHKHQYDEHYKNVILHVVYDHDEEVYLSRRGDLPVLELRNRILPSMQTTYEQWLSDKSTDIVCKFRPTEIPEERWMAWRERLRIEKLEEKHKSVEEIFELCQHHWLRVLFVSLATGLGFSKNALAMQQLALSIPFSIILKLKRDEFALSALFFGQAGMLESQFSDSYPLRLKSEYQFLRSKHQLQKPEGILWQYGGVRPPNFPTIRIAQLVSLVEHLENIWAQILKREKVSWLKKSLKVSANGYWRKHYKFDRESESFHSEFLSEIAIELLIVNVLAQIAFAYSKQTNNQELLDYSLNLSEVCKPEDNQFTRRWSSWGMRNANAADSQALMRLIQHYCQKKRCLECAIGHHVLTKEANDKSNF